MESPKITYYNYYDLDMGNEVIPYLLQYGRITFKEEVIDKEDLSTFWYYNHWVYPHRQLPIIEMNNNCYTDMMAIGGYIAEEFRLLGCNKLMKSVILQIVTYLHNLRRRISIQCLESDRSKCYCNLDFTAEVPDIKLACLLEVWLELGTYIFGKISYLDIFYAVTANQIYLNHGVDITFKLPNLRALVKRVLSLNYIQARDSSVIRIY